MNKQAPKYSPIISTIIISLLLVACSVDQKNFSESANANTEDPAFNVDNEPPMINNPEGIVLPSADYVNTQSQVILPKPKSPLTKQQLFTGKLDSHNRVRAKHGLKPLKWSNKLAAYSQQWADQLGKGNSCKMYHRSGSPPYGENLYISSAVVWSNGTKEVSREKNRVTIRNVVKVWADEEKWYDYKTNRCRPGKQCGHYTQIVWRATTEVGCAVKFCGDQSQNWVCSYNPPGNYVGKRPY